MIVTNKIFDSTDLEIEINDKKQLFYQLLSSDLDFRNGKEVVSRHNWHSFPAKFPPELPRHFIENLTKPNDIVLDPMSGSCTTLLESVHLNRFGIGYDIDPLSLIIGKAKLQNINTFEARSFGNTVFLFL